jgi:hypothetical protein
MMLIVIALVGTQLQVANAVTVREPDSIDPQSRLSKSQESIFSGMHIYRTEFSLILEPC